MIWLYILVASVIYWLLCIFKYRLQYPPGPIPFMIVGNLPQLGYRIIKYGHVVNALHSFKDEYGPVFTIWIGPMVTVHIAEYNIAVEEMIKNGSKYADRYLIFLQRVMRKGQGIIFSNGQIWQEQRRFALHTLRNFGLGRNIMEERIMEEFEMRFSDLDKGLEKGNNVVNPAHLFDLLVGSIVNRMLFSFRFEKEDEEEFFKLKHKLDQLVENLSLIDLYCNDWLYQIPILNTRWKKLLGIQFDVINFVKGQIQQRVRAIESGEHEIIDEGEDFVDAFLLKMEQDKKAGIQSSFNIECLAADLADLWGAGLETTISTLCWSLIRLLHHPEVLEKIRKEVQSVTGSSRTLSLTDKKDTPYLNAVITEIQRLSPVLNLNLWRKPSEDVVINGHNVPANTAITAQLSMFLTEEASFKNHKEFNPDRYLEDSSKASTVVPFGIGKRACLGESLARAELYLILGNISQRYKISPNGEKPSQLPFSPHGMLNRARHFTLLFEKI